MLWQYSDGNPLKGALNPGGVGKNHDSRPLSGCQINDCWSKCDQQLTVIRAVVYHSYGARLFMAQIATRR